MIKTLFILLLINHSFGNDWLSVITDQLSPWENISSELVNKTYRYYGTHVIFQYIDGKLWLYDPEGYCSCNRTLIPNTIFGFHMSRCKALGSILNATITNYNMSNHNISNFEFVWSLDDFPSWNNIASNEQPYPGFGSVRCWMKGTLAFPFYGSHYDWHIDHVPDNYSQTTQMKDKLAVAVFRGGKDRGCSIEPDKLEFHPPTDIHNHSRRGCGRYLLYNISQRYPELIDYRSNFVSLPEQSERYRYVISAEGFGGWADRLEALFRTDMLVINQEHPCDQWFEPLIKPYQHYIPVANNFHNLVGRIIWANRHKEAAKLIQQTGKEFANEHLTHNGILEFMATYLKLYSQKISYKVRVRTGAISLEMLWDYKEMTKMCKKV